MEANPPADESNEQGLNKIDLSQLQDFTFGTQWTEVKPAAPSRRDSAERGPGRERRDDGPGGSGEPKRDRRSFRKPAGDPTGASAGRPGRGADPASLEPRQREDRPRRPGGERVGPPRGERREGAPPFERAPYLSPYFNITCYPEDAGFAALVKAVRASCRTFQLFEIAKAILEKNDRFVVMLTRRSAPAVWPAPADQPAEAAPAEAGEGLPARGGAGGLPVLWHGDQSSPPVAARKPAPADKPGPLYVSVPDGLPFDTEEAAIYHVIKEHLGVFFDVAELEIEPPKGNFPIINKCTITGELLGPPNYHRYQQIIQQHHATRLGRMPFERFRERIESVRDPEVVNQWLEKMKKTTSYTWKIGAAKPAPPPATTAEQPQPAAGPATETPAPESTPTPETAAPQAEAAPAAPTAPAFHGLEEARAHLLAQAREKAVRAFEAVRFHGRLIEKLPPGEIRRAIEGHVERQRRFPLDTANALRGRLRREGFTIFKKGARGVSYVCAVKRRFRVPGQVFSDSITALIDFIEKHPMIHRKDLAKEHLGIDVAAAVAAAPLPEGTPPSQAPFAVLPSDQAEKLRRMNNDLRWLVIEGYVTEFSDGKLFAPPPMASQAQKKADEQGEEHDPVDFPDARTVASTEAPAAGSSSAAQDQAEAIPPAEAALPVEAAKPEGQA